MSGPGAGEDGATVVAESATATGGGGGVLRPLAGGLVLAVVLAWTLLSPALSLLFMLGVFFFMLFGLIIGATMYRLGSRGRPLPKSKVIAMTVVVALVCWSVAILKESLDYPEDFVYAALKSRRFEIPKDGYEEVHAQLHAFIVDHLERHHSPGGVLGYLRLAAAGSPVEVDLHGQPRVVTVRPRAAAWVWWTRGVLSLALLYVAVYSVTAGLAKRPDSVTLCHYGDGPSPDQARR